ncbi:hypothetical protein SAMN05421820_101233 [Pedobacter steynii]|uniref:Uncharacterized protein n=1 Tax=Pedobacter steynii TaxID=430522 RepID=A0A1G9JF29_9SPHI|nr:hypothetical protein [Pedobacter steynii]NQX38221.1 hypothetical protein [Pedobacter steynii]SDL35714.1 hypothetical protein SAMN05421820_101233 [Pedobacter steynii]
MQKAIAFSNNDVITIAWSFDRKPEGCLGFAIYRINPDGHEESLPNKAVFPDTLEVDDRSSARFPIQKFYWKDVYARPVAERTGNSVLNGTNGIIEVPNYKKHVNKKSGNDLRPFPLYKLTLSYIKTLRNIKYCVAPKINFWY